MIGWILSFALVVIFLLFMKDFVKLLFSGVGLFFILGLVYLDIGVFATLIVILSILMFGPMFFAHESAKQKGQSLKD
tara:strand:- start:343 stop:573 length:231 start_codon:yes stop_codon:yes gene_type:complete